MYKSGGTKSLCIGLGPGGGASRSVATKQRRQGPGLRHWRSRGAHCVGGGAVLALGQDAGGAPGQLMSQEARARRVRLARLRLQKRAREADHTD